MTKIKVIPRKKLPKDSLSGLENIIKGVKSGDVTGFAYTAIRRDGAVSTGHTTYEGQLALIGGLEHCKQMILQNVAEWKSL